MSVGGSIAGLTLISQFGETRATELFIGECEDGRCLVKLVRPELCADRGRVERALAAARTVGALDHRGIEFVIEAGWDGDRAYVLGDIVPGTNATRLVSRRSLEADAVAVIVTLIADALAAAHAAGVVHGALEPVLVHVGFASDRVIVRDFGVAELHGDGGAARAAYRAPEGGSGTPADVYALGAIAREMLAAAIGAAPDAVTELFASMVAPDPAARPTAAAVRDELEALARAAENVAVTQTAIAQRRRAPTEPPEGGAPVRPSQPPRELAAATRSPSLLRSGSWRCDRCGTRNARGHAFCLHCSAPAVAAHDVSSVMASLAADGSDEVTPPPGPPPEPPPAPDDDGN